MDTSICILNRDQRELLKECLDSCYREFKESNISGEVIVVDNGSSDGSPAMVRSLFPEARLISNSGNAGFSTANNQAIRVARGRYVLVLNNDTVLLPGCLRVLLAFMDAHPEVGAAGPKLLNRDGSTQLGYHRRLPTIADTCVALFWIPHIWPGNPVTRHAIMMDEVTDPATASMAIEQVGGCAMFLRREAMESVGLFDEAFYRWFEDVDLCERLRTAGWSMVYVPGAQIVHYGGAYFQRMEFSERAEMQVAALLRYFRKHRGRGSYNLVKSVTLIALTIRLAFVTALAFGPVRHLRHRWRGVPLRYLRTIKCLLLGDFPEAAKPRPGARDSETAENRFF